MSFGGHYGWLVDASGNRVPSKALAVSVWTPIAAWLELRAEAFTGQALAGLGGGGIGQNMVIDGVPVRTKGGWVQLNVKPSASWEIGGGGGIDDPDDEDLLRDVAAAQLGLRGTRALALPAAGGRAGGAGDPNALCRAGGNAVGHPRRTSEWDSSSSRPPSAR